MIISALDMYKAVLNDLSKTGRTSLEQDEFNDFVNKCQLEYVLNREPQVDKSQKRRDDLRTLRRTVPAFPISLNTFSIDSFLPDIYLFLETIGVELEHLDTENNSKCKLKGKTGFLPVAPLPKNRKYLGNVDPFLRPKSTRIFYEEVGNQIIVYPGDDTKCIVASIEYIKHPKDIVLDLDSPVNDIDSELPFHARKEVCDMTVRKILENIESRRYQSISNEQSITAN